MSRYPIRLTQLVHENLSVIMSFVYSRAPLTDLMQKNFIGEWKYLGKALFEVGEEKANRAITELALLLRILDDEEKITDYHKQIGVNWKCGSLVLENDERIDLSFREFSNKIIHAKTFAWEYSVGEPPLLKCYAREDDKRKWKMAEVGLVSLAGFCGQFMS